MKEDRGMRRWTINWVRCAFAGNADGWPFCHIERSEAESRYPAASETALSSATRFLHFGLPAADLQSK